MAPKEVASVQTSDTCVARVEAANKEKVMREMYILVLLEAI
jgi:hypothetical protein